MIRKFFILTYLLWYKQYIVLECTTISEYTEQALPVLPQQIDFYSMWCVDYKWIDFFCVELQIDFIDGLLRTQQYFGISYTVCKPKLLLDSIIDFCWCFYLSIYLFIC